MTNAEKLAKDTEKLAFYLCSTDDYCKFCCYTTDKDKCLSTECEKAVKEWLESEAEEERK